MTTLDDIPCGTSFQTCKFIKDAYAAKAQLPSDKEEIDALLKEVTELEDKVEALKPEEAEELLEKHEKVTNKKSLSESENSSFQLRSANNSTLVLAAEAVVKELTAKVKEYEDNKEAIENLEDLIVQKKSTEKEMSAASKKMTKCEMESSKLNRAVGSLEQKVANAIEKRDEYLSLQEQFSAYDLYMRCMHPNGIAYDVIKRKLPVINESISKVLSQPHII